MKILWVKANKLLPLHSGGDIRSYHIARYLSAYHELCFFSYYDGPRDEKYEQELAEKLPGSFCISSGKAQTMPARALDYAFRLADTAPYAVSRFRSTRVRGTIQRWFDDNRFDVAVCDFLDAAINFPASLTAPTVMFQHNVESEIWRRHSRTQANPAKRQLYTMEFRKMLAYEKSALGKFVHVIAVSENDRQLMSAWIDPSRITVVPTGVDLSQYRPGVAGNSAATKARPIIAFVGAMDWEPNIDAVEFFCRDIWPAVKRNCPEAIFRIVGRNPDRRVQQFAGDSIQVTGRVAAVIDHLREAKVVIVPLRIGGGTRLKIYEAMAAGKAIVSTTVGAEGLDVHHGQDICLADEPEAFAKAIQTFLRDNEERGRYEQAAAKLAAQYDWSAVAKRFEAVLEKTANQRVPERIGHAGPTVTPIGAD